MRNHTMRYGVQLDGGSFVMAIPSEQGDPVFAIRAGQFGDYGSAQVFASQYASDYAWTGYTSVAMSDRDLRVLQCPVDTYVQATPGDVADGALFANVKRFRDGWPFTGTLAELRTPGERLILSATRYLVGGDCPTCGARFASELDFYSHFVPSHGRQYRNLGNCPNK